MAALSPGAIQEGRWQPLFWSLCARRRAAADAQLHAQEIWCPHLWTRRAYGARIEVVDLPGASALERNRRGAIPRSRGASLRFSGRTFARNDLHARGGNA